MKQLEMRKRGRKKNKDRKHNVEGLRDEAKNQLNERAGKARNGVREEENETREKKIETDQTQQRRPQQG